MYESFRKNGMLLDQHYEGDATQTPRPWMDRKVTARQILWQRSGAMDLETQAAIQASFHSTDRSRRAVLDPPKPPIHSLSNPLSSIDSACTGGTRQRSRHDPG